MDYKEELEFVINSKNEIFPDFLFTPIFNDFGDEYYKLGLSMDPKVIEAQKIRRKYKNYFDYIAALVAYHEYMNGLVDKYGSISIIKNSVKVGLFDEFIPPMPRLKMTKANKELVKSKIFPSRQVTVYVEEEDIKHITEELYPIDTDAPVIDEYKAHKKPNKGTRKILKRAFQRMAGENRKNNLYRSSGVNEGVDFIVEYMNQANKGYYDQMGTYVDRSISEILKEEKDLIGIPEEIIEDNYLKNQSQIVNGRMVKNESQNKLNIMTELYKMGVDILHNNKNMDKKAVKMIRQAAGDYDVFEDTRYMSKRELKEFKKRKKKERDVLANRRDNDKALSNTLELNKYSFDTDGNNISFRLRDMYKDD